MAFTKRTLSAVQGTKQYVSRDLPEGSDGYASILISAGFYSYATEDLIGTVTAPGYFPEDCLPYGSLIMIAINTPVAGDVPTVVMHLGIHSSGGVALFTAV